MKLKFTKMHGAGNDFVVLDGFTRPVNLTAAHVRALANRHFGIGADQLLLVEKPTVNLYRKATRGRSSAARRAPRTAWRSPGPRRGRARAQ